MGQRLGTRHQSASAAPAEGIPTYVGLAEREILLLIYKCLFGLSPVFVTAMQFQMLTIPYLGLYTAGFAQTWTAVTSGDTVGDTVDG